MKNTGIVPGSVPEDGAAPLPATGSGGTGLLSLLSIQLTQALVLVALFALPASICLMMKVVQDPDVWSHLRSGEWILEHSAVPHTDPFSIFGAGRPWEAYSWLFELLIFQLFQRLGLVGFVVYSTAMVTLVTAALFRMLQRLQADFLIAAFLTGVTIFSLHGNYTPRPWWFTILFFTLELDVLMQARKTGKIRDMLWLPLLFALWANLHIEFIDGLIVLAIAVAEAVVSLWRREIRTRMRVGWLCLISLACVLAPLANPYGWRIYRIVCDLAKQSGALNSIQELSAITFRDVTDWLVLVFALSAVVVLARARRFAFFEGFLLAFAMMTAFRTHRDVWLLVISASAILAGGVKGDEKEQLRLTAWFAPIVVIATGLILFGGFRLMHVDNTQLSAKLAKDFPVRAVEVVKEKGWSGPLYNDFNWGGYLIWALRMPVEIDGRTNVYGNERIGSNLDTWGGLPGWATDGDLQKSRLVIGPVKAPLTELLRLDPRFELKYEDKLAAVFVRRSALPSCAVAVEPVINFPTSGAGSQFFSVRGARSDEYGVSSSDE